MFYLCKLGDCLRGCRIGDVCVERLRRHPIYHTFPPSAQSQQCEPGRGIASPVLAGKNPSAWCVYVPKEPKLHYIL